MSHEILGQALARLLALLAQERKALVANDIVSLGSANAQKLELIEQIATLSSGISLNSAPKALRQQAVLARREAKINSDIASGRIAMTHAKLSLIAQQSAPGYGSDGKQASGSQGGLLDLSA